MWLWFGGCEVICDCKPVMDVRFIIIIFIAHFQIFKAAVTIDYIYWRAKKLDRLHFIHKHIFFTVYDGIERTFEYLLYSYCVLWIPLGHVIADNISQSFLLQLCLVYIFSTLKSHPVDIRSRTITRMVQCVTSLWSHAQLKSDSSASHQKRGESVVARS